MRSDRLHHHSARPHLAVTHHHWRLAQSIQMSSTTDLDARHLGVVAARRHATGWFIAARHRPDLSDAQRETFREFVTVRTHSLLNDGPHHDGWVQQPDDEWLSYFTADLVASDARSTPDTVPAHWN